jgi:hypothetical protein
MKSAVVIIFDKSGKPVECKLACHKQKKPALELIARRMMDALKDPAHVCRCGGNCQHKAAQHYTKGTV